MEAMAENYKKAYLSQAALNHQNKVRKVNLEEEKKALAILQNFDQQMLSKHN